MNTQKDEIGKKVDEYVKKRAEALTELMIQEKRLAELGVKFGTLDEKETPIFELSPKYLPQFLHNLEEYEWDAQHGDYQRLRQYDLGGDHHFGDIKQDELLNVRYVSNFETETDNEEKRVIVNLDWETGQIFVVNGKMSVEDRNEIALINEKGPKKLILFKRVRWGQTMEVGEKINPTPEIYIYKRYFLGWETADRKVIVCLYPNGEVKLEK